MRPTMIRRHSRKGIFLHWFNTACWLFLLFTGVGLLNNRDFQPLGMWWPGLVHGIFGAPQNLLVAHEICGILWITVLLVYSILFWRTEVFPFLKEIFTFSVRADALWLFRKMTLMTAGSSVLKKLGHDPQLPEQGFYNVGQKMFAGPAVFGGIIIACSGLIMTFETSFPSPEPIQWSILIHYTGVCLVLAGLLVHIFMAAIAKGEEPAFWSMLTGYVPEEFAKEHNPLWYRSIKDTEAPEQSVTDINAPEPEEPPKQETGPKPAAEETEQKV